MGTVVADRRILIVASIVAAVALAGCAQQDGGNASGGPYSVSATQDSTFDPETITIAVGETVEWTNDANFAHTVTSYDVPSGASSFDSDNMEPGETFSHTFQEAGTYEYRCTYHSSSSNGDYNGMVGTVVVEA